MVKYSQQIRLGYNVSELSRLLGVTSVTIRNWERQGIITRDIVVGKRKVFSTPQIESVFRHKLRTATIKSIAYVGINDTDEYKTRVRALQADIIRAEDIPESFSTDAGFMKLLKELQSGDIGSLFCNKITSIIPEQNKCLFRIFCDNLDITIIELKLGEE